MRNTIEVGIALADYIFPLEYGCIIHSQEIEQQTGERRGTSRYYSAISKAKKILTERGKVVKSIGGGDYQIIYPGDYSTAYVREVRIANNHIKRGGKILKGAPVNDMTLDEKQSFDKVFDFHASLQAHLAGCVVEVKKLSESRHPLLIGNNR